MESACFPLKNAIHGSAKELWICYPGRKVPGWFKSKQGTYAYNNISIELPSTTTDLIGFVLCSVLSPHAHDDYLQCQIYYDGKKHACSKFGEQRYFPTIGVRTNSDSHHVFLWCVSDMYINLGKTMDGQNTNYRPKVSFEFSVVTDSEKFVDGVIEACGVCPIYASECPKFIQQMELEANLSAKKETCQDAYENSFHGILEYAKFSLKTGKCGNLEGSNIPEWFTYKSFMKNGSSCLRTTVQLAPDFDELMGFIFCFVIPNFSSKERDQCCSTFWAHLKCEGIVETTGFGGPRGWHYSMSSIDNVFLWYFPFSSECILKYLQHLRRKKGCDAKPGLQFSFDLGYGLINGWNEPIITCDCLIKEFGVRPIDVSEYTNFLQQEKLKVSMGTKRHRNIDDDQQQLLSKKKLKKSTIDQSIPMNSESKK